MLRGPARYLLVLPALAAFTLFYPAHPRATAASAACSSLVKERRDEFEYLNHISLGKVRQVRHTLLLTRTDDPAVADAELTKAIAAVKTLHEKFERATPDEEKWFAPWFKYLDDYVAFWRAKSTELKSGGLITTGEDKALIARLNADLTRVQRNAENMRGRIDKLDAQIAECERRERSQPQTKYSWNGTWSSGPYTIQISGGFGSLTYTFVRSEGAGGCCPTTDKGSGSCTVRGSEATCTETADYHDSDKDVQRSSTVTLTLSGDTISSVAKIKTASITLANGQVCPDIAQCTGLHPGAEFSGTWTRKRP